MVLPLVTQGQLKAFPTAYGGGAYTTGGAGGCSSSRNYNSRWNTNRNVKMGFSLKITQELIVFDVSGIFNFDYTVSTEYPIGYGDVTIAGETAPEGGVTLTGNVLFFQGQSNVIIRTY